jgi:hypothetical protein
LLGQEVSRGSLVKKLEEITYLMMKFEEEKLEFAEEVFELRQILKEHRIEVHK